MLVLMFDPWFKNMQLVVNYLGRESTFALVKEHDVHLLSTFVSVMLQGDDPFFVGSGGLGVGQSG